MHTSRSHHHLLQGLAALALAVGVAACSDDEAGNVDESAVPDETTDQTDVGEALPGPTTVDTSTAATTGASTSAPAPDTTDAANARVPDGRYARVVTAADAERLGVDPGLVAAAYGGEQLHLVIEIEGDRWRQLGGSDPDRLEIGDVGSSRYDDEGNWVTTSESEGCPGCTATITWSLDGDTLVLVAPDGLPDIDRLMIDGAYRRTTSADDSFVLTGFLDFIPLQVAGFLDAVDTATAPVPITADLTIGVELTEAELIDAVAAGEVDIAFVGARAFPRFDPLLAPLTVDNYELQEAVFGAGIPAAMLADLGVEGVVGVAVTPGPFRKLMGVDDAIDEAADLDGAVVDTDATPLAEKTFSAFGATPVAGADIDDVDAFAIQLQAISGNNYENQAASVTANANMWPRALTVIMNADAYARLTPQQQATLIDASRLAADSAIAASRAEDDEALGWICESPMQVVQMADTELEAMRAMVEPVIADLRQNPVTAAEIDAIEELKATVDAAPDTFTCS